jgi:DNA-binding MarR family transcriptional regulator
VAEIETDEEFRKLTPEIQAMMGVFALYWKLNEQIDLINTDPQLSKLESRMMIRLDAPRRMGVMAKLMLTVPSAVTAAADSLEARGFLIRRRDPEDRRAWLIELTEAGWEHRREMERMAVEVFYASSGLTGEETRVFSELSGKIFDNVMRAGAPEGLKTCE